MFTEIMGQIWSEIGKALMLSLLFIVPYILYFILTRVVRNSHYSSRRNVGNIMLATVIPGVIVSVISALMFLIIAVWKYMFYSLREPGQIEPAPLTSLTDSLIWLPEMITQISSFVFVGLGLIAIISGFVIIKKDLGKIVGLVTLIAGVALPVYGIIVFTMTGTSVV